MTETRYPMLIPTAGVVVFVEDGRRAPLYMLETEENRRALKAQGIPEDAVEMARCIHERRPGPGQPGYPGAWHA